MSLLARFRKPGGRDKLVALLESSESKVRENILKSIRAEDPAFTEDVEERLFFWPDIFNLSEGILAEIMSAVQPKNIALAIYHLDDDQKQILLRVIDHQIQAKIRDEQEILGAEAPKALIATARAKILETARALERDGKITLTKDGSRADLIPPDHPEGKMPTAVVIEVDEETEYQEFKKKWSALFAA